MTDCNRNQFIHQYLICSSLVNFICVAIQCGFVCSIQFGSKLWITVDGIAHFLSQNFKWCFDW